MPNLVIPRNLVDIRDQQVVYLAGPVSGGGQWQITAFKLLGDIPNLIVAIPDIYPSSYPIMASQTESIDKCVSSAQWERHYMELAAKSGCLVFWLGVEDKDNPRKDGKPYAMSTRFELGEWAYRLRTETGLKVVVGADNGFPGLKEVRNMFSETLKIVDSLESTIQKVKEMI